MAYGSRFSKRVDRLSIVSFFLFLLDSFFWIVADVENFETIFRLVTIGWFALFCFVYFSFFFSFLLASYFGFPSGCCGFGLRREIVKARHPAGEKSFQNLLFLSFTGQQTLMAAVVLGQTLHFRYRIERMSESL